MKIGIFKRFIKSISDFSFINIFSKEKTGKVIGFAFVFFLCFALLSSLIFVVLTKDAVEETKVILSDMYDNLPDFTLKDGIFSLDNNETYKEISIDGYVVIILDLESEKIVTDYYEIMESPIVITKSSMWIEDTNQRVDFSTLKEFETLTKESFNGLDSIFKTVMIILFIIYIIVSIIGSFILTLIMWCVTLIVNGIFKFKLPSGLCYKITVYSLVVPLLLKLVNRIISLTTFNVPMFWLIFLGVFVLYTYKFMKNYDKELKNEDTLEKYIID